MTYGNGTRVLVWRLEETPQELLALCRESAIPTDDLMEMPVHRQREKAVERLLLCLAFGRPVTLGHTDQGAPLVVDSDVNISITHTSRLVALALDNRQVVGLDAELADRRQVLRVRSKFLNAGEQQFIDPDDLIAHVVAWTAKEAIIKAERNSAIDWTNGISLEPFAADRLATEGIRLAARCGDNRYHLTCRLIEEHCLSLAVAYKQ